jgi:hypothetical protein
MPELPLNTADVSPPTFAKTLAETFTAPLSGALLETEEGRPILRGVTILRPGISANRRVYTEAVLKRDGPSVFEGAPAYVTQHVEGERNLKNLVGQYRNVQYAEGAGLKADLIGLASEAALLRKAMEAHEMFGPEVVGVSINTPGHFVAKRSGSQTLHEVSQIFRSLKTSVDLVTYPAAGGRLAESLRQESEELREFLSNLTEAVLTPMNEAAVKAICGDLSDEEIREANPVLAERILAKRNGAESGCGEAEGFHEMRAPAPSAMERKFEERLKMSERRSLLALKLNEANLGEIGCELVRSRLDGKAFEEADVSREIGRVRNLLAQRNPVRPYVPGQGGAQVTERQDHLTERIMATFERKTISANGQRYEPYRTITEMILDFEPERARDFAASPEYAAQEAVPLFAWNGGSLERAAPRLREATGIDTSAFTAAWADSLNRSLRVQAGDPELSNWRQIVSRIIPFRDLTNTHKVIRVGELGTAPTVGEGQPYQYATRPTNDQETVSIVKKGFLHDVTWEAILRDDISVLARIPGDMARSFNWTVYDAILSLLQQNSGAGPTMNADSTTLYHANHNNLHSLAFSAANLTTVRQDLAKQTDPDSGKRKSGYRAKRLIYQTPELDQAIWEALASEYKIPAAVTNAGEVNLPNFIRQFLNLTLVPVIYPTTTTTRWELMSDPMMADTIVVGFLNGRDAPDLFIQNMETVGSRFTADKVTYKLRFTVGASVVDWRAFSRGNV